MRRAHYSKNGQPPQLVTLGEYLSLPKPKTGTPVGKLTCPNKDCQWPVYPYGASVALGFSVVGCEATLRHPEVTPGFRHFPENPHKDCPLYKPDDPRFDDLEKHTYNLRARERVQAALTSHKELNHSVFAVLMKALRGSRKEITEKKWEEERNNVWQSNKSKFLTMEVLADHPWLLPYFLVLRHGGYTRISSRTSKPYMVTFASCGEQKLPFTDSEGQKRLASVPRHLVLYFVNDLGKLHPMSKKTQFAVTREDSYALVRMPLPEARQLHVPTAKQGKPYQEVFAY